MVRYLAQRAENAPTSFLARVRGILVWARPRRRLRPGHYPLTPCWRCRRRWSLTTSAHTGTAFPRLMAAALWQSPRAARWPICMAGFRNG